MSCPFFCAFSGLYTHTESLGSHFEKGLYNSFRLHKSRNFCLCMFLLILTKSLSFVGHRSGMFIFIKYDQLSYSETPKLFDAWLYCARFWCKDLDFFLTRNVFACRFFAHLFSQSVENISFFFSLFRSNISHS